MKTLESHFRQWSKGVYYANQFRESIEPIRQAYTLFSDKASKRVFIKILQSYVTTSDDAYSLLEEACGKECPCFHFETEDGYEVRGTANPYFLSDIFSLEDPVVLLDGGAYIGDTIELAYRVIGDKLHYYYALEPNENSFARMRERLDKLPVKGELFQLGLDDSAGIKTFDKEGADSRLAEDSAWSIETVSAGDFIKAVNPAPTFIKLDIEGSEKRVLESMRAFIAHDKPMLAISAYHALDDLWEIPLLISNLSSDYKIYLRHQSNYFTETVCYAYAR